MIDVIDGILDYPTYFSVINGFGSPSGNLSAIPDVVGTAQKTYHNALLNAGSFLENHDQPRFQNITKDAAVSLHFCANIWSFRWKGVDKYALQLVRNAVTWPFIQDGLPILYYGQEQGYDGSTDPNNREACAYISISFMIPNVLKLVRKRQSVVLGLPNRQQASGHPCADSEQGPETRH